MTVLQLTKVLTARVEPQVTKEFAIRQYAGPVDIERWLELRHRAFARLKIGVRRWDRDDFEREFLQKSWWAPERLWLAESTDQSNCLVGTVALAERAGGQPAVHWLAVDPRFRRRGIGRLLMSHLEAFCWDQGQRQIWLETHSGWESAAALYQKLGYRSMIE